MAHTVSKWKAAPLPARTVNVWALLQSALDDTARERPADSVTPAEYAERAGISERHARDVLARDKRLRQVAYRRDGKRATCYVVAS
jgi:hypothetical protein